MGSSSRHLSLVKQMLDPVTVIIFAEKHNFTGFNVWKSKIFPNKGTLEAICPRGRAYSLADYNSTKVFIHSNWILKSYDLAWNGQTNPIRILSWQRSISCPSWEKQWRENPVSEFSSSVPLRGRQTMRLIEPLTKTFFQSNWTWDKFLPDKTLTSLFLGHLLWKPAIVNALGAEVPERGKSFPSLWPVSGPRNVLLKDLGNIALKGNYQEC